MRFLVLGPLEVVADGGEPLPIAGSKERSVLVDLIAHAGRVVSVDELIGEIWGEQLPRSPEKALWSYVSRLRRALLGDAASSTREVHRHPWRRLCARARWPRDRRAQVRGTRRRGPKTP